MQLKQIGIFVLLALIVVVATMMEGNFLAAANLKTLIRDTALYGLISIGVAFVIITGGIDLSIGSMIALCGVMMVMVVNVDYEREPSTRRIEEVLRRSGANDGLGSESIWEKHPAANAILVIDATDSPPNNSPVQSGDQLIYRGTIGDNKMVLLGEQYDGAPAGKMFWLTADAARSLQSGSTVTLARLTHTPPLLAAGLVLLFGAAIGWMHGMLITRLHLQPFVVTLCGLLIYRGLARVWTGDDQIGLGSALGEFKTLATGSLFAVPLPLVGWISGESETISGWTWIELPLTGMLLIVVALAAWIFMQHTVGGRHLLATGENPRAAMLSGIATNRLIVGAYMVSGMLAALAGVLFLLEWNSVQPGSSGNFYELYAIAAAVLGGCSLRGGRGAVLGVIAGAAVMRCLYKAIVVTGIDQQWEMVIIGAALLISVLVDELVRRWKV